MDKTGKNPREFTKATKDQAFKQVGGKCSKCSCSLTGGDLNKINYAHICAKSPQGPRYDASMTDDQVKSIDNCIVLCENCHKIIDTPINAIPKFTKEQVLQIKNQAIQRAENNLNHPTPTHTSNIHIDQSTNTTINNIYQAPIHPQPTAKPNPIKTYTKINLQEYFVRPNLVESLFANKSSNLQILYGPRGIGKTSLARYYATIHDEQFDNIFWISCDSDIDHEMSQLYLDFYLDRMQLDKNIPLDDKTRLYYIQQGQQLLEKGNEKSLLIFDSVDKWISIEKYCSCIVASTNSSDCKIQALITTIDNTKFASKSQFCLSIYEFDLNETIEFISQIFQHHNLLSNYQPQDIQLLSNTIPKSPLFLNGAVYYIIANSCSIPHYIELLNNIKGDIDISILDTDSVSYTQSNSTPYGIDAIAVLKLSYIELSEITKEFLHILCIMDTRNIPMIPLFQSAPNEANPNLSTQLQNALSDTQQTINITKELKQYALIDFRQKDQNYFIDIHGYVQWILNALYKDKYYQAVKKGWDIINAIDIVYAFKYINCLFSLLSIIKHIEIDPSRYNNEMSLIYVKIFAIYHINGETDYALEYSQRILEINEKEYADKPNHPAIANSYNNMGLAYLNKDEKEQAFDYFQKALLIYRARIGESYNSLFGIPHTCINIGVCLIHNGEIDKALELFQYLLEEFQKKILKFWDMEEIPLDLKDKEYLANIYFFLGEIYSKKDNQEQALCYYEKAFSIRREIYANDLEHPEIAIIYANLGTIYLKKDNLEQALYYHEKALSVREKIYVNNLNHFQLEKSYSNIGAIYLQKDKIDKALFYIHKALSICKKIYADRPNHPSIEGNIHNIQIAYKIKGEREQALYVYEYKNDQVYKSNLWNPYQAEIYYTISIHHYNSGDLNSALYFFQKSIFIFENCHENKQNPIELGESYNNIVEFFMKIFIKWDKIKDALDIKIIEKAKNYIEKAKNIHLMIGKENNIAESRIQHYKQCIQTLDNLPATTNQNNSFKMKIE